jgi:hypothetical protein
VFAQQVQVFQDARGAAIVGGSTTFANDVGA